MPRPEFLDFQPDFIIAGATRCGTSSLHEGLNYHPLLCLPHTKEIKFFYQDALYGKGAAHYATYFSHRRAGQFSGEVCPLYFDKGFMAGAHGPVWRPQDDCAARIHAMYPQVPIIFSLRNPIKRAHSIFWKNKWQGRELADSFEQAVEEELAGRRAPEITSLCFLWRNHYKIHIERWLELFPREKIHIIIFEEWTKNPQIVIDLMRDVLGLPDDPSFGPDVFSKKNEGRKLAYPWLRPFSVLGDKVPIIRSVTRRLLTQPGYPPLSPDVSRKLQDVFAPDVAYLESFLGRRLDWWVA